MNNDHLNSILSDLAENAKPAAQIDLWPGLKKSLAASDGQSKPGKSGIKRTPVFRRTAFAALAVLVAFAILFATPQGQAIAQDLLKYFTTAAQKWLPPWPMPAPVPTYTLESELTTAQPTPADIQGCGPVISPISSTFLCQLEYAQAKLGYIVKSFSAEYVDAPFHEMNFNFSPEYKTLRLSFRGGGATYTLEQKPGDFPAENMGNAIYQEAIQLTQVGKYPAEYAAGAFIFSADNSMTWNPTEPVYHLRWKEAEKSYSFTMSLSRDNGLTPAGIKEKMLLIAENLVTLDQGAEQLTAGNQPSIKDSAGFAIKEPSRLPGMFHQVFATGWNYLIPNQVNMLYEYTENGEVVGFLELSQIPIPADKKNLRWEFAEMYRGQNVEKDFSVDEEVQINGAIGHYLVPNGELPPQALYWRDNEREYILICQWTSGYGGKLSKEDLIAIAESLK
jgi:hypothetical protein